MTKDAYIEGPYRYWLLREWDSSKPRMCSFMLNPSDADAVDDDPTLRRNIGFAKAWGYGGLEVVNPYAYRTPSPKVLRNAYLRGIDIVGPRNLEFIHVAFKRCALRMVAWGAPSWVQAEGHAVLKAFPNLDFHCFGRTNKGCPTHPLYLRSNITPVLFRGATVGFAAEVH